MSFYFLSLTVENHYRGCKSLDKHKMQINYSQFGKQYYRSRVCLNTDSHLLQLTRPHRRVRKVDIVAVRFFYERRSEKENHWKTNYPIVDLD